MADLNNLLKKLVSSDAVKGITKATGVDSDSVTKIMNEALPSLISGVTKQSTGKTAASFVSALASHAGTSTSNLSSFFKNVDLSDGSKIVSHLMSSSTISSIAKKVNVKSSDVSSVLSAATPYMMSLLGQSTSANKKSSDVTSTLSSLTGLIGNEDVSKLATNLLSGLSSSSTKKTTTTSTKKATTTSKKTTSKKEDSVDLSDVISIAKKLMK